MSIFITDLVPTYLFGSDQSVSKSNEILDQVGWQTHFDFEVEGSIPPIPNEIQKEMASLEGKKNAEGEDLKFSLLLMPKGLDFEKFKSLVNERINKFGKKLLFLWEVLGTGLKNSPINESYWVIISHSDIAGSRGISLSEKLQLAQSEYGVEYDLPLSLEALVALYFQMATSKEPVYDDETWAYTLCKDGVPGQGYRFVINGASKGAYSECDCVVLNLDGGKQGHKEFGVAVCRRFLSP